MKVDKTTTTNKKCGSGRRHPWIWAVIAVTLLATVIIVSSVFLARNRKRKRRNAANGSSSTTTSTIDIVISRPPVASPVWASTLNNDDEWTTRPPTTSPTTQQVSHFPSLTPTILREVAETTDQPSTTMPTTSSPTTTNPSSFPTVSPTASTPTTLSPTTEGTPPPSMIGVIDVSNPAPTTTPTSVPTPSPTTPSPTPAPTPSPTKTEAEEDEAATTFLDCLGATSSTLEVVVPSSSTEYSAAKQCLVYPPGTKMEPSAIVRPASTQLVQLAIKCAATFGLSVSARSGAHSFKAQSCRGELIVDLSLLDSLKVNPTTNVVTWGAGQLHGQLYARLIPYNLIVSGGSESMVGTGGLWLGCGRGYFTQAYGFSCQTLKEVEYVDYNGELQIASTTNNQDMFWMARGGGDFFPGIVTKLTAQAHVMPSTINQEECLFDHLYLKEVLSSWIPYLDKYNDPSSKMFSGVAFDREPIKIEFNCFGCTGIELEQYNTLKQTLKQDIAMASDSFAELECSNHDYTFEEKLLSRQWDACDTYECLLTRSKWPEWKDNTNLDLSGSAYNGAIMVPESYEITEALIDEIVSYFETSPGTWNDRKYLDFMTLYPMKGSNTNNNNDDDVAFGGGNSKLVIHYKKDRIDSNPPMFKEHMDAFERALHQTHGLPCKSFYNYQDEDLECAGTDDDAYLAAFFSDPDRLKRIVQEQDPNNLFFRLRLNGEGTGSSSSGGGSGGDEIITSPGTAPPPPTNSPPPPPTPSSSSSSSQMVSTTGPMDPRLEACFIEVGDKAYLIGGRDGSKPVNEFDPATGIWTTKSKSPIEVHHMQCVAVDAKVYILNAWTGNFPYEQNVEQILVYDTVADSWSGRVGLPEPRQRGGGASVVRTNPVDGTREIYVSHGNRGGHGVHSTSLPWFDMYNVDLDIWMTNLPDAPNARDHTGGALITTTVNGGTVQLFCVAGGRDSGLEGYLDKPVLPTDCFNFATGSWEVKDDIPQGRAGSAYGTTCDGKLAVAGGEGFSKAWNNVDVFDGSSWTSLSPLIQARHGTGLASFCNYAECGDETLISSGAGNQGGEPVLESTERINVPGSSWKCA
uniref:FAD-binding PCMH-type domain-containing protein n=1 Tax=Grammatophora oceanica TaxID=210454 RepID=A0A6U5H377_9STRA|mmetsp:Transcript_16044/g.23709  ORF Transcript_16044/g.23709 Transcript_16044/m.23709 type:complete len:1081 (+) Transcript_16044:96-3338(+)